MLVASLAACGGGDDDGPDATSITDTADAGAPITPVTCTGAPGGWAAGTVLDCKFGPSLTAGLGTVEADGYQWTYLNVQSLGALLQIPLGGTAGPIDASEVKLGHRSVMAIFNCMGRQMSGPIALDIDANSPCLAGRFSNANVVGWFR
jgi:hypothetical protein